MTRIVAGTLGGRRLAVPRDRKVRPTADRVREAWMSILGPAIPGARVVDLFAGSGALGLEMLSRGAREAHFVELAKASLEALARNIEALGVGREAFVHTGDAMRFVDRLESNAFDLAVADPPYAEDYAARLVERFRARPFAAIFAVEHPAGAAPGGDQTRRYGDTALTFCYAP